MIINKSKNKLNVENIKTIGDIMKIKSIKKIYYTGNNNTCTLTDYSCRALNVPKHSWFSMRDSRKVVYAITHSGGSDNTYKNVYNYELIQRIDTDTPTCMHNVTGFCDKCRKEVGL